MSKLVRFFKHQAGATSIEYCLIAGLISIVIVAGATQVGLSLKTFFLSLTAYTN